MFEGGIDFERLFIELFSFAHVYLGDGVIKHSFLRVQLSGNFEQGQSFVGLAILGMTRGNEPLVLDARTTEVLADLIFKQMTLP